jgi:hypothetical protein
VRIKFLTICILVIINIFISGCLCCDTGYSNEIFKYNHSANKNVTINVFKHTSDNITVYKSNNNSNIEVVETFYFGQGSSSLAIEKYVKFIEYEDKLTINISLIRMTDEQFASRKAYANVDIYLPNNTNYTLNYVEYNKIKNVS